MGDTANELKELATFKLIIIISAHLGYVAANSVDTLLASSSWGSSSWAPTKKPLRRAVSCVCAQKNLLYAGKYTYFMHLSLCLALTVFIHIKWTSHCVWPNIHIEWTSHCV